MRKATEYARHMSFWLMFAYGFSLVALHVYHNLARVLP